MGVDDGAGLTVTLPDDGAPVRARDGDDGPLAPGAAVGRYRVVRRLGAGGMGVVYVADDPELGRRVALKVVDRDGTQAALVGEARALAALQHPNVVAVHDVGIAGGRVFVAMDLVAGTTLRGWLDAAPRGWRRVVAAFAAAGRGLGAAHAAGLVHRDFKPENVLVGDDGSIRVADFGLARPVGDGDGAGTPPYMAPEQHRSGGLVTEAADQFAFACALWEAVYGRAPFAAVDVAALALAKRDGRIAEPPAGPSPRWLGAALRRALAPAPADRHPSLAALIDALERGLGRRRRTALVGGAVALAAMGAAISLAIAGGGGRAAPPCDDGAASWSGVWDPARAAALHAAFARSGRSYADATADRVAAALDDRVTAWRATRLAVCQAGARREAPAADVAARIACLDRERARAAARIALLTAAPAAAVVDAADAIAGDLDPPHECAARTAADDADTRERTERLARLEPGWVALRAGDLDRVLAVGKELEPEAIAAADQRAIGLAAYLVGYVLTDREDPAGDAELVAAVHASTAARDWPQAGAAYALLIETRARRGDIAELAALSGEATAVLQRLPTPEARWSIGLALARGELARGNVEQADRDCRAARADAADAFGAESVQVAVLDANCSDVALARDDNQAALAMLAHAVDVLVHARGPDHPSVANARQALAIAHRRLGHLAEALRQDQAALAIREAVYGPSSAYVADSLASIAFVEDQLGDSKAALATAQRALAATEQAFGATSRRAAASHVALATVAASAGDRTLAHAEAERGFALYRAAPHDPDRELAYAQIQWAQIALGDGDADSARTAAAGAATVLAAAGDSTERYARAFEGQAALEQHLPAEAIAPLERALALTNPDDTSPDELAQIELALAQALYGSGRDRPRAKQLALGARRRVAELGDAAPVLAELDRWLAHPH